MKGNQRMKRRSTGSRSLSPAVSVLVGVVFSLLIGLIYVLTTDVKILLGTIGVYLSIAISLLLGNLGKFRSLEELNRLVADLIDTDFTGRFLRETLPGLRRALEFDDEVYRTLLDEELSEFSLLLSRASSGTFHFKAESWRRVWKMVLGQDDVQYYYSIALVRTSNYWQDSPGRASIEFNIKIAKTKKCQRIVVLWPSVWDDPKVRSWISKQREAGIGVAVVRKESLPAEEDVLHDLGVYGDRAVGYQHLRGDGSTSLFELHFDKVAKDLALQRFRRLEVYATEDSTQEYLGIEVAPG